MAVMTDVGEIIQGAGGPEAEIGAGEIRAMLAAALEGWGGVVDKKILVIPPDITRLHSGAGEITALLYELTAGRARRFDVMPALGTHAPMTVDELGRMFPGVPLDCFKAHDWREGVVSLGEISGAVFAELSGGRLDCAARVLVNRRLVEGEYDLICSVGQVVPHEVVGLANHNKNILVGLGGPDFINKSHYLGAVCGMEGIMGRIDTPVRRLFDAAEEKYLMKYPIKYIQTVREAGESGREDDNEGGRMIMRGVFIGEGRAPFLAAARLAQRVNITRLERPIAKALVYLDPAEYRSTWLANKAIYRTRMALADDGELIVLAPGVRAFGEDAGIDRLIRRYGYHGMPHTLGLVEREAELRQSLAVAAHLIQGSSEGRFRITYAAGGLTRAEVEAVGYAYAAPAEIEDRYQIRKLRRGVNEVDGEEIFFIDNPSLGLWATGERFPVPTLPETLKK